MLRKKYLYRFIKERKMEWFETWFDSEYYHKLYKNRNHEEAELFIDKLISQLQLPLNSSVLDLACGKGRHSRFLNQKGYTTTGVDLSVNSIDAAKIHESKSLHFEVRDMRIPFCENKFDAILNLFTSFGYFDSKDENLKVLTAIETMLKDTGIFVIDFMNAHKTIENLVKQETKRIDNVNFKLSRSYENGNIIKQIEFTDKEKDFYFKEKVQALFIEDFESLINQTNLKIDYIFGDYNLNSFNKEKSDRLILIGSKI